MSFVLACCHLPPLLGTWRPKHTHTHTAMRPPRLMVMKFFRLLLILSPSISRCPLCRK
jgi:hypothetical protein